MSIRPIVDYLQNIEKIDTIEKRHDEEINQELEELKVQYIKGGDEYQTKTIWCYQKILSIQKRYLENFFDMKRGEHYSSWCGLERVEIDIHSLSRHWDVINGDEFRVGFIEKHVTQFQKIFPYRLFFSPAILQIEKKCSICGEIIQLRHSCGHKKGEIYHGEECIHKITKAEILEISTVTNPVQKYSVLFFVDPISHDKVDHYDYSLVDYVIKGLNEPFNPWDINITKIRHPHSLFSHLSETDNCPCGSGKSYGSCCRHKSGVLRPHMEILFHAKPLADLPRLVFPEYAKK